MRDASWELDVGTHEQPLMDSSTPGRNEFLALRKYKKGFPLQYWTHSVPSPLLSSPLQRKQPYLLFQASLRGVCGICLRSWIIVRQNSNQFRLEAELFQTLLNFRKKSFANRGCCDDLACGWCRGSSTTIGSCQLSGHCPRSSLPRRPIRKTSTGWRR